MSTLTEMTIWSNDPGKWRFVDLETGQVWMYVDGNFVEDLDHQMVKTEDVA